MTQFTLDRDSDGRWTLTRPLCECDTPRLRLTILAPGTPHDWHIFSAAVTHSGNWLELGTFDIAPAQLTPMVADVGPWNPDDEEDFQQISIFRAELAEMVRIWGRIVGLVVPALTLADDVD